MDTKTTSRKETVQAVWRDARRTKWMRLGVILSAVAVVAVLAARFGPRMSDEIAALEQWIAGQGVWGPVVFAGALVLLTSVFVPDSLLAAAAGALFGVALGFTIAIIGVVAAQCLAFGISRHFLHDRVHRALADRPRWQAVERAADRQGLRLQFLLRLVPVNPVAVSHVVGVTRVGFLTFFAGCLGLIPHVFVEVYCGYMAKHMLKVSGGANEHSTLHLVVTLAGLAVCVLALILVTRSARKALAETEQAA